MLVMADDMEKIVSLAKRRGFVFPGSEIYGGLANSWDFGPLGAQLKRNIKNFWWKRFVERRDDIVGLDGAIIMNPKVWEASGHLKTFSDPLVECKKCHSRFRADQLDGEKCPECGAHDFTEAKQFNLMFQTFIGAAQEQANVAYLRPETAQTMFTDFKAVLDTTRKSPPFGIAQIGKSFRNEITPGNFIFRTREFEIMEIEYFIPVPKRDDDWAVPFEQWRKEMHSWMSDIGLVAENIHELEVLGDDLAHYSKRTLDFEYDYPFGRKELYGLAYRTDFDLKNHEQASGENLKYKDQETGEEYWPHVIEPTWGVERTLLAVLCAAYDDSDSDRTVLKLKPYLAPFTAAVFPLLKNKPDLVAKARALYDDLRRDFSVAWDERGNIGKRYFSQDEIGTPFCITVDFDTLEDDTVTIRERDSAAQERVPISELHERLGRAIRLP